MGHWGWRQMTAVFISVWVVGCSITHEAAPTAPPTQPPYSTLVAHIPITSSPQFTTAITSMGNDQPTPTPVVYTVQPGDTLLQIARRFGVKLTSLQEANGGIEPLALQIGQTLRIPNPQFNVEGSPILPTLVPAVLPLSPPNCYASPTDTIVCLGQVTNVLDEPIQRVSVLVRLFTDEGEPLIEGAGTVEQSIILPGETAPYRLLFRANWEDYAGASVWLESADSAPGIQDRYIWLMVDRQEPQWENGHYTIKATLYNPTVQSAQLVRAVVTLRDEKGQIFAYRILQLDGVIKSGEMIPLEVKVTPETESAVIQHSLYVEAVKLEG